MPQVVDPESQLETLPGQAAGSREPGVVDQAMQRQAARQKRVGAVPNRSERAKVQRQEFQLAAARMVAKLIDQRLRALGGAAGQEDMGASLGERQGGDPADSGIGPGDQCDAARQGLDQIVHGNS